MPLNSYQIASQQVALQAKIKRAQTKLADLERKKRLLRDRTERMLSRLRNFAGVTLPQQVARKIEARINSEGWMEEIVRNRFKAEAEHGPGSRRWRPLKAGYAAWRIKHGYGARPILKVTGVLKEGAIATARNTFSFKGVKWDVDDVPVSYAPYVQGARKYFDPPTQKEMKPTMERVRALVRAELRRMARGQGS